MKRLTAVILALMLSATPLSALAEPMQCAAKPVDIDALREYWSFEMDDSSGDWSVGSDAFVTLLENAALSDAERACIFQLRFEGNALTGLIQPMLDAYYMGSREIMPQAISLLVEGVRYDIPVSAEEAKVGKRRAEHITAPLTQPGMDMLSALSAADEFEILLHGEKRVYHTRVERDYDGSNDRRELEKGSFHCVAALNEIDMQNYNLWDLNAAAWIAKHESEQQAYSAPMEGSLEDMLKIGDSGTRVKNLEKLLSARWFLAGDVDSEFGSRVRDAVIRAQQTYGFVGTGSADARLLACLEMGEGPYRPTPEPINAEALKLGDSAEVSVSRYWLAHSALPTGSASNAQGVSAGNSDNLLLIIEGEIRNTGAETLDLNYSITGTLEVNGYSYECKLTCERDGGKSFGGEVIPMGSARLIITAEIPKSASELSGALRLQMEDSEITIDIA